MKSIARTEAEMADLRAAADYIPVYTRPVGNEQEKIDFQKGCFRCRHAGSNMDEYRSYSTIWVWGFIGNAEEGPQSRPIASMTFSWEDTFYQRIPNSDHWLAKTRVQGKPNNLLQTYTLQERITKHSDGALYVRHIVTPKSEDLHYNNRVYFKDIIPPEIKTCQYSDIVIYSTPILPAGVYAPPFLILGKSAGHHNNIAVQPESFRFANEQAARRFYNTRRNTRGVDIKPVPGLKRSLKKKELSDAATQTAPSAEDTFVFNHMNTTYSQFINNLANNPSFNWENL